MNDDKYETNKYETIQKRLLSNIGNETSFYDNLNLLFAYLSMDNNLKYQIKETKEIMLLSDNSILSTIVSGLDKQERIFKGIPFYVTGIEIKPVTIKIIKDSGIFLLLTARDKNLLKDKPTTISSITELKNVLPTELYNKPYNVSFIRERTEFISRIETNQDDKNKILDITKKYNTSLIFFKPQPVNYIRKTDTSLVVKKITPITFVFSKTNNDLEMILDFKEKLDEKINNVKVEHSISFDLSYPPQPKMRNTTILIVLLVFLCVVILAIISLLVFL
jgi:hypothetical protein